MYTSISRDSVIEKTQTDLVNRFEKMFRVNTILRASNMKKAKGVSADKLFWFLLSLVFSGKRLCTWLMTTDESAPSRGFEKDTVYRLLNDATINWFSFLSKLALTVITGFIRPLTDENRRCVLIVDDTFIGRTRSKHVELASLVHDHTDGKTKRGFRLLTMGFSDGVSFIPCMFRLLASKNPLLRTEKNNITKHHKNSLAAKRREDALTSAPEIMLRMLKSAVDAGIPTKHVLFDSWFSAPTTLVAISKLNLFVVAMMKITSKQKVVFEGIHCDVKQIYSKLKKRPGRAKYLACAEIMVDDKKNGATPAKLVFVRDRVNKKKWLVLVSTDVSLSPEEIIELYGIRWDIEVFFKVNKSFLRLTKEFQGQSFEIQNAQVVIAFTRYIMMAVEQRKENDQRTMGLMFHFFCDEQKGKAFSEALALILSLLVDKLSEYLFLTKQQINVFMDKFIDSLPAHFNVLKLYRVCET